MSDEALGYIINETDKLYDTTTKSSNGKSGVRQIKHVISSMLMKINIIKNCVLSDGTCGDLNLPYYIDNFKLPFIIHKKHVDKLDVMPKIKNNDGYIPHMYM